MPREKELYRDNLERLDQVFPGRDMLRLGEAAKYTGIHPDTLRGDRNFPKRRVGRNWMVPKTVLASWLS